MFTFGIIYSIVLCGFSQAFYFLYKGHPQVQSTMFNTYTSTWMALFQTTLGDYNVSVLYVRFYLKIMSSSKMAKLEENLQFLSKLIEIDFSTDRISVDKARKYFESETIRKMNFHLI